MKRLRIRSAWSCALLLGLCAARAPQDAPRLAVQLSTPLVKLGGQVSLVVTVRDARSAHLSDLPSVDGLEITAPGRPVESHQSAIFNGRIFEESSLEWAIRVRPTRAGEFEIPPLEVIVDGAPMRAPDAPLRLRVIADVEGAERGYLAFEGLPDHVYEGQPFALDLRFGWDQDLALAEGRLYLPWWDQLRGVLALENPADATGAAAEVFVNDRQRVRVERLDQLVREGRVMTQFRLRRRFLATRPDDLELGSGTFQFAELIEQGVGFRPDKVQRFYAQLPPATIDVRPIPEQGRPLTWTGAVGKLQAGRRVDRRDVDAGDPIALTVYWYGDGNLEFFEAPDLSRQDAFRGFRVIGTEDEKLGDERRVTYQLVPGSEELSEIPPVPLWVFDPELERFVEVRTESVPIRVRAVEEDLAGYGATERADELDLRDLHPHPITARPWPAPGAPALGASLAGVLLGYLALRTAVRRRSDPSSPEARRRRGARRALARELARAQSASEQAQALARFLAARTGEPEAAWVGRDPRAWLAEQQGARGEPQAIAELARLSGELDEEAWSGGDAPLERERIERVARALCQGGL